MQDAGQGLQGRAVQVAVAVGLATVATSTVLDLEIADYEAVGAALVTLHADHATGSRSNGSPCPWCVGCGCRAGSRTVRAGAVWTNAGINLTREPEINLTNSS